jgi:hypothetical protein
VRRWETMATVAVATLGLLAPAAVRADIPGYTFKVPISTSGPYGLTNQFQAGDVNNKGQFCGDPAGDTGEREFAWDGTKVIKITDADVPIKTPDGATITNGIWSPQGINNNGIVAWIADVSEGTGPHYVMAYDLATSQYTIVARPGDKTPEGTTYPDANGLPAGGRMVADINDLDQVFWTTGKTAADGTDYCAIYMYDLKAKKGQLVAAAGMKTTDGKTISSAYWPDTNNSSQCTFTGSVDGGTSYGTYMVDLKGTITPIIPAGSTIDGAKIGSVRWARLNNNGDVVATADFNGADQGPAYQGGDDTGVVMYRASDKSLHVVVKPGDKIPGGTYHAQEGNRRTQGITDKGEVFFLGTLEESAPDGTRLDGVYRWDPTTNKIDALVLGNTTVAGLGKVGGVTTGNGGNTGYHMGCSGDGHLVFSAVVDGAEGYVLATPPP